VEGAFSLLPTDPKYLERAARGFATRNLLVFPWGVGLASGEKRTKRKHSVQIPEGVRKGMLVGGAKLWLRTVLSSWSDHKVR